MLASGEFGFVTVVLLRTQRRLVCDAEPLGVSRRFERIVGAWILKGRNVGNFTPHVPDDCNLLYFRVKVKVKAKFTL